MVKHIVVAGPLQHDGKPYSDGDEIDLVAEAARVLIDLGVIVLKGRASKPAQSDTAQDGTE
jgi:hypothetical protein